MTSVQTESPTIPLLKLLAEGPLSPKDKRFDPLEVVGLMDQGLVDISPIDATIRITAKGQQRLGR